MTTAVLRDTEKGHPVVSKVKNADVGLYHISQVVVQHTCSVKIIGNRVIMLSFAMAVTKLTQRRSSVVQHYMESERS